MPRYRLKSGSSSLIVDGKRVSLEPGDVVECGRYVVESFLDQFECLDPEPEPAEVVPEATLKVVQRRGESGRLIPWFDVVNVATGEPINDRALKKKEAEELVR